jgi:peptidoglycan/LPS O-acetylase OafA/YrhL
MGTFRSRKTDQALGSTAAGMMMAVLRILQTLVLTALVSVGVLLLASADFNDASDLVAICVATALLLLSVLMLPADSSN